MANHPFIRRILHWWFLLSRPLTLGVRILARDEEGRVLLVRHTYISGWHLPGGGVEIGETLVEAAGKELREETSHHAVTPLTLRSIHYNRNASPRDHVALFVCDRCEAQQPFEPNREIAEIGFFEADKLPEGTTAGTRRRINEVLSGVEANVDW